MRTLLAAALIAISPVAVFAQGSADKSATPAASASAPAATATDTKAANAKTAKVVHHRAAKTTKTTTKPGEAAPKTKSHS